VNLLAGTSGYAFKEWKGSFYPPELKNDAWLGYYAGKFPTVEINNTFYRLPKADVVRDWAEQTPAAFTFAIKASQRITHYARLKPESGDALAFLLKTTSALEGKLAAILFQLPPNLKQDLPRLHGFIEMLPANRRFAFEFRHESWFDESTFRLLRDRDIALCIAEQDDFSCPVVCTASWGYLRLHRLDYGEAALTEWAKCVGAQSWSDAYVYFKHDEGIGSGPPAVNAFLRATQVPAATA
jgi:uncharacterized protein YecE (DUF72 family)